MPVTDCRYFNGYKPCGKSTVCNDLCPSKDVPMVRLLVVHLGALGAVVRSTSLLAAIKRKFPSSHITWVTDAPAHLLFQNQVKVDRVLTTSIEDTLILGALEFDVAFCVDKSLKAAGVLAKTRFDLLYGYQVDPRTGGVMPATPAATEYWELGLDDQKKFFKNQKPETQLICEALELDYLRDRYDLVLSPAEILVSEQRRKHWLGEAKMIIGVNTGCSPVIAYKKLSIPTHRKLISELIGLPDVSVVLLGGGPEDDHRNKEIGYAFPVHQSRTMDGLRDGLASVQACDLIVTGDSLGMHMSIALKKWTLAWFGPTCEQEIDLYDRGEKIVSLASCGPCWKRSCQNSPMCYDLVPIEKLMESVQRGLADLKVEKEGTACENEISLSKLPSLETHSSPYR
jgi:heptosyltransferase-2